ncbi:hypothetical protein HanPSC8_Chr01g0009291 [Helianthus annuus]|nr:hypothetical protein HanHA89_Chr01g0008481 [Helianthus annuus]KAJ0782380.1 hypothetical protein HanLR1_Chr01g0007521 [Helianthus annuus]KAJ0955981.1 hypothetical protein HanPSC8_Chr01g0009291 [Helianthus annuus]
MLDVKDRLELERNMSSIRMGEYRLKRNVARFVLEEGEIKQSKVSMEQERSKVNDRKGFAGEFVKKEAVFNNMPYKEAFSGVSRGKLVVVDDNSVAFEGLHGRGIIVRLKSLFVLQNIKGILKEMKLHEGVVRCLDGLMIMIELKNKEHAAMALDEIAGRSYLFSEPEIWEGQSKPFERIVWLKVFSIPLCMTDNKVVNDVGNLFGEVIKSARVERCGLDASFQFIGVLVKHGKRIQEEAFLRWRGKTIRVWVMEDSNDWLEDFILDPKVDENNVGTDGVDVQDAGKPFSEIQPNVSPAKDSNGMENFSGAVNDGINDNIISENEEEISNVIEEKSNLAFKGDNFSDVIKRGADKKKKRKKVKIFQELGQASVGEYVSCNERPIKEAKVVEDDPFDLDPVILGLDSNVVKDRGTTSIPLANSFQALLEDNDEN